MLPNLASSVTCERRGDGVEDKYKYRASNSYYF